MSDMIADFIAEMLSDGGGVAELQRRQVADRFSCVPSQVNYVIYQCHDTKQQNPHHCLPC